MAVQSRGAASCTQLVRDLARAKHHGLRGTNKAHTGRARRRGEGLKEPSPCSPRYVILNTLLRYLEHTATLSRTHCYVISNTHTMQTRSTGQCAFAKNSKELKEFKACSHH